MSNVATLKPRSSADLHYELDDAIERAANFAHALAAALDGVERIAIDDEQKLHALTALVNECRGAAEDARQLFNEQREARRSTRSAS